jgi:hypothetical protein
VVGPHLHHNVAALTRLVRVLGAQVAAEGEGAQAALDMLGRNVLPAVALLPGNAALVMEVWAVVSKLPYPRRFCLYADLRVSCVGVLGLCHPDTRAIPDWLSTLAIL